MVVAACSSGGRDGEAVRTTSSESPSAQSTVTGPRSPRTIGSGRPTTVVCNFRDLLGVVVLPDNRRIEILETNQEFAGDTGLPPRGVGTVVAALTADGLTVGPRCRDRPPANRIDAPADLSEPWPETAPTWLRCGLYGDVLLDARRAHGGYVLSVGRSVRASILPKRRGGISFSSACRRFVVTGAPIP
jgi:hypothetical protein